MVSEGSKLHATLGMPVSGAARAQASWVVQKGLRLSGLSPDGQLVEMIELPDHPWFVGCQFHPELQSRPTRPHPLFAGFVAAATAAKRRKESSSETSSLVSAARQ